MAAVQINQDAFEKMLQVNVSEAFGVDFAKEEE